MQKELLSTVNGVVDKAKDKTKTKLAAAGAAVTSATGITFCGMGDNANGMLQNVIKIVFNLLTWGGIVVLIAGVVTLIKSIIEASQGQAQPGAIGKALGLIAGGVIMIVVKPVVQTITGSDPTTYNYMGT